MGLRDSIPVGASLSMLAGSAAQILLAWEEPDRLHRGLQGAKFTATTLSGVRRRGWAQSVSEREVGVASVSAPVRGPSGRVVAAVSISGSIERLTRQPGRLHAAAVVAAAGRLTEVLRRSPGPPVRVVGGAGSPDSGHVHLGAKVSHGPGPGGGPTAGFVVVSIFNVCRIPGQNKRAVPPPGRIFYTPGGRRRRTPTSVTLAEYGPHVDRIRLVRALVDVAGLSLTAVRRLLAAGAETAAGAGLPMPKPAA